MLALALLLCLQEPTVAELLKRLETDDIGVREKAEADLSNRGASALPEVEAAWAKSDAESRVRLRRVLRRLKFTELLEKTPAQFSEGFRGAASELLKTLKKGDPGSIIEAIASTAGRAQHWELVPLKSSHGEGSMSPRRIVRPPLATVSPSDGVEVLRLALRSLPQGKASPEWTAVKVSVLEAINRKNSLHARELFYELLEFGNGIEGSSILIEMAPIMPRADRILAYLALLDCQNPELRQQALSGVWHLEPGRHGSKLLARLPESPPEVRRELLRAIGRSRDTGLVKSLLEYADLHDMEDRSEALAAAAKLDPRSVLDRVLVKLRSKDVRDILQGLEWSYKWKGFGKPPLPEWACEAGRLAASHEDPTVRAAAFNIVLRAQGVGCSKEHILVFLKHADSELRRHAPWMAVQFRDDDVVKALTQALDDSEVQVAAAAASALATMDITSPIEKIRTLSKSKVPQARQSAVFVLSRQFGKDAAPELLPFLDDEDPYTQTLAIDLLLPVGKGLEPRIREKLKSGDESIRMAAARTLAGLGDRECIPFLKAELEGSNWNIYSRSLFRLLEPDCFKKLSEFRLPVPQDTDTRATLIERLRIPFKDLGLELDVDLPSHALEAEVGRPEPDMPEHYWFGSIASWLGGSEWFCDGRKFHILTPKAAKEHWIEWAASK